MQDIDGRDKPDQAARLANFAPEFARFWPIFTWLRPRQLRIARSARIRADSDFYCLIQGHPTYQFQVYPKNFDDIGQATGS
jgi:hypothetical protein